MNYQELYLHSWLIWLLYDCFKLKVMPSLEVCLMRYVPTLYFPNHLKHLELTALTRIFRVIVVLAALFKNVRSNFPTTHSYNTRDEQIYTSKIVSLLMMRTKTNHPYTPQPPRTSKKYVAQLR